MQLENKLSALDLAIIITTSPIRSNPSTEVIDQAISTILKEPSLDNTTIFVICDGAKVVEVNGSRFKSGIISTQQQEDYLGFKQRLKEKYQQDHRIIIEERSERYGFAENIKYVMQKIPHQFVLIFQHDHVIVRPIDFSLIINTMKTHPINYIGIMNRSVFKLSHELDQHMGLRKYFCQKVNYFPTHIRHDHEEFTQLVLKHYQQLYGVPLMPLLFWYDKVHVARKSYYLDVIFSPQGLYDEHSKAYIKTVSFVEDSFGTVMRKAIRRNPEKFEQLRAFIYWDKVQATIAHINGRAFITQEQKEELFFKDMKQQGLEEDTPEQPQEEFNLELFDE